LEPARRLLEEGWLAHDLAQLTQARAEGNRAVDIARSGGASAALQHEAEVFQEDATGRLGRAEKDRALLQALLDVSVGQETWTSSRNEKGPLMVLAQPSVDEEYADAFRRWGLDVDSTVEAEAVAQLGAEPAVVVQEVIAALDSWMLERRRRKRPEAEWRRLFRVAEQLDRSEQHRRLRAVLIGESPPRAEVVAAMVGVGLPWPALWESARGNAWRQLLAVQKDIELRTEPALTVLLLAQAYAAVGDTATAEKLLRRATTARPDQAVLLGALGKLLERQGRARLAEAIEYYRAARGQRRQLGIALSKALLDAGRAEEAEEVLQELEPQQSNNPAFYVHRGVAAYSQRKPADAETAYRKALALALKPDLAEAYANLGKILQTQRKYGEAEAVCRKALTLRPDYVQSLYDLGNALMGCQRYIEAEAAYRKAITLKPDFAEAHTNLGISLFHQGKYREAESAYRKALAVKPDLTEAHYSLSGALMERQKYAEAEAVSRKAIELKPDFAEFYYSLGNALMNQGKLLEAEAAYRKAVGLKPDLAPAYNNLGLVLMRQFQFDKAGLALKKAAELFPANDPHRETARRLQRSCLRYAILDARRPGFLRGTEKPADAAEQLDLAQLYVLKQHYAAAARSFRDAFTAEPKLAEAVPEATRYDAACAAALAGGGQGKDAGSLGDKERASWRRQALEWLRQDLTWWGKVIDKGNAQTNVRVREKMRHWQSDPDLAGVRAKAALARLPGEERKKWERLWLDVDALFQSVSQQE
jgi:tetratricopeptide (TPR) repeat protein